MVAAVVAGGLGLWQGGQSNAFQFDKFAAYALVGCLAGVLGLGALWRGVCHQRSADEANRVELQLLGFEAYISPMPDAAKDLMRGTMAQQLFPRLAADSEPWREPDWPSAESLLKVLQDDREARPVG